MTPKLNWKLEDEIWCASLFLGFSLVISHNGEDYYNVIVYDQHGDELYDVKGAQTIETAKENCLVWLKEELKKVTHE